MKKRFLFIAIIISGNICSAQTQKIDLSKAPNTGKKPMHTKSNAEILSEVKNAPPAVKEQKAYTPPAITNSTGSYNQHLQIAPSPNNINLGTEPIMLNTQQSNTKIGNMNTNSTIYYDNSGKIRSTNTSIKLGK